MLISLVIKYFFHNKKRTYRAVAILAVGISLVLSTDMLLNGYISQVEEFSQIVDIDSRDIEILPTTSFTDGFSSEGLERVRSIVSDYQSITVYLEIYSTIAYDSNQNSLELTLANLSKLKTYDWIQSEAENANSILLSPSSDLPVINNTIGLNFNSQSYLFDQFDNYLTLHEITSEVIIDFSNDLLDESTSELRNSIFLRISSEDQYDEIIGKLNDIEGIEVLTQNAANTFLKISGQQVTLVLLLLQLGMSLLLILSISYVMLTLINESEDDIRIFKMMGLEKWSLFMIFMGQSILASLFAALVGLIFSVMILYALLPIIALTGLPYGVIVVNLSFFGITLIQSLFVGLMAGIYPSYLGSK